MNEWPPHCCMNDFNLTLDEHCTEDGIKRNRGLGIYQRKAMNHLDHWGATSFVDMENFLFLFIMFIALPLHYISTNTSISNYQSYCCTSWVHGKRTSAYLPKTSFAIFDLCVQFVDWSLIHSLTFVAATLEDGTTNGGLFILNDRCCMFLLLSDCNQTSLAMWFHSLLHWKVFSWKQPLLS